MLVRATEQCFFDNRLRQAGEIFEFSGPMPPNGGCLVPADEEMPRQTRRAPRSAKQRKDGRGDKGVPAPSWTGEGHRELGGQQAPGE